MEARGESEAVEGYCSAGGQLLLAEEPERCIGQVEGPALQAGLAAQQEFGEFGLWALEKAVENLEVGQ